MEITNPTLSTLSLGGKGMLVLTTQHTRTHLNSNMFSRAFTKLRQANLMEQRALPAEALAKAGLEHMNVCKYFIAHTPACTAEGHAQEYSS